MGLLHLGLAQCIHSSHVNQGVTYSFNCKPKIFRVNLHSTMLMICMSTTFPRSGKITRMVVQALVAVAVGLRVRWYQ
jgi:hypothetical protein